MLNNLLPTHVAITSFTSSTGYDNELLFGAQWRQHADVLYSRTEIQQGNFKVERPISTITREYDVTPLHIWPLEVE